MRVCLALLPLLGLLSCMRAPLPPDPALGDETALRAWMDHNLAGIRRAGFSARVHMDGPLGQGQVLLDGDWQQGRGLRMILRTPLGTELARLDSGGEGLAFREPRLAPLLQMLDHTLLGELLSGELESRARVGLLLWGDLRPGRAATFGASPAGPGQDRPAARGHHFSSGDTLWQLDPATALCDRLEYPGTRITLERFHRVGGRWQPRLLRLRQDGDEFHPAHSVVVEYRELDLRPLTNDGTPMDISVVIPLLNERESLPELIRRLREVLADLPGRSWELILVDDGSTDGSIDEIRRARQQDPRVRFIRFRRNFGKSDALHAGFAAARGEVIFTMDADLQDDPKEIPRFLELLETGGWDLVSGWKKVRHDPLSKTLPSRLFNRVTSAASGVRLHDFNCGFKCYRRAVVQALEVYGELHRFLPALAHMKGFRVTEMVVEHHARRFGSSKFGLSRFINGFLDLLTVVFTARYLKKPMHFFGPVSLVITGSGLVINGWLAFAKLVLGQPINGRPLLFLGMLLLIVGVQLLSLGLLGEMLTRQQKSVEYQVLEHSPDPDEPPAAGARAL